MSYQVLARKWRPRFFAEMVGQEHVLRALINALDNNRLHHAFLFTGTRGVGKTTIARILAKSLNCERGIGSQPCGECGTCREIDEGRFVDLIEVDAASRTKVEDTRDLLENVQYAPTRGRYKVYLIDEVHMLSTHSFNALLKTLEEPPPHVKFLLATTDPQKLPVTILSRCLQFNLKRLPQPLIAGHLGDVLGREGIEGEGPALQELARAADGSMRDALSLLDQAIAFGGGRVGTAEVQAMLGTIEREHVFGMLDALAAGDAPALLERVERLAQQTPDFNAALADLLTLLQRVALAQAVPAALDDLLGDRERLLDLAARVAPEDLQLFYQIGLIGRRDLPLAPDPRGGLEMVLLRMLTFRPAATGEGGGGERPRPAAPAPRPAPPAVAPAARAAVPAPAAAARPSATAGQPAPTPQPAAPVRPAPPPAGSEEWGGIVEALGLRGVARQLAVNCALVGREGDLVRLALDPGHAQLRAKASEERLQEALGRHFGAPVRLAIEVGAAAQESPAQRQARHSAERQAAAERAIAADPTVVALQEQLDARVIPGSVRPLDGSA